MICVHGSGPKGVRWDKKYLTKVCGHKPIKCQNIQELLVLTTNEIEADEYCPKYDVSELTLMIKVLYPNNLIHW